ncbi:hypothetical protein QFC19_000038 [Naganishia cerealis]|uniref:Uncharacterized protein n=1 Tax=Naganishia cerealis TaxID=610337 RepID=A0ACC2WQ00_9TREE|nr:hypothetical protein QFC19_000038 [Naganishia cerealis]
MSNAHRPTWAPAVGRESKSGSRSFFQQDFSARTKLKFRTPGQGTEGEVGTRDLKAELARAEREALDKKRKAKGLPPLAGGHEGAGSGLMITEGEDEQVAKRRKLLEEAAALDADDSDDDEDEESGEKAVDKGKGKAVEEDSANEDDSDNSDSDSDSDDDEDDTAALMAELAKIKQERAEEAARLAAEQADSAAQDRDAEIALGNPLLNLQAALGQTPDSPSARSTATAAPGFAVKRRWDDDLIFKNQAVGQDDKPKKEFINDILRSEFHRKFMSK